MKLKRYHFLLILNLITIAIIAAPNSTNYQLRISNSILFNDKLFVADSPIRITDNSNFSTLGFPGTGTSNDPYVITNLSITTEETCISIINTTAHFRIKNCILNSAGTYQCYGIYLENVTNGVIESCTISLKDYGIYMRETLNCTVQNCSVESNLNHGAQLEFCRNSTLKNNRVFDNSRGITIVYSANSTLFNNTVVGNSGHGLYLQKSNNSTILNNTISQNNRNGIYLYNSTNVTVANNTIWKNLWRGISGYQANYSVITNNRAFGNGMDGIYLSWTANTNVTSNRVYSNENGIHFYLGVGCMVTNNSIHNCADYGMWIEAGSNERIFWNRIAWNNGSNAFDDGSSDTWDDEVSLGNYWNDYMGSGVYTVLGIAGSVDNYPMPMTDVISPTIDSPSDRSYEGGTTGNTITWKPRDQYPSFYRFYIDDVLILTNPWDGTDVTVSVDDLGWGPHDCTLKVYDGSQNTITDSVTVTVVDTTSPIIDAPADTGYEAGTTGHSITWNPHDLFPKSYLVKVNGSDVETTTWDGSSITVNFDGLNPGSYNYTLFVFDMANNSAKDSVFVKVVDTTQPNIILAPDVATYEEGSTGNILKWNVTDLYPSRYEAYLNGTFFTGGNWTQDQIIIVIDNISEGHYQLVVVFIDQSLNNRSYTVNIAVLTSIPPSINQPNDINYEAGLIGHSILWTPRDLYPSSQMLFINGVTKGITEWNGSDIKVDVDGLNPGIYNYTLVVIDKSNNMAHSTVMVTVIDSTPPMINQPTDIVYTYGSTGNILNWTPTDLYPSSFEIWRNDTHIRSGDWTGEAIIENVDGLDVGLYNYTIFLFDLSGNQAKDSVAVRVNPKAQPISEEGLQRLIGIIISVVSLSIAAIIIVRFNERIKQLIAPRGEKMHRRKMK